MLFRSKAKNDTPIGAYDHRPEAFHLAFKWMQAEARQIHMGDGGSSVKRRQNIPQLADMVRIYAARVVMFKETL